MLFNRGQIWGKKHMQTHELLYHVSLQKWPWSPNSRFPCGRGTVSLLFIATRGMKRMPVTPPQAELESHGFLVWHSSLPLAQYLEILGKHVCCFCCSREKKNISACSVEAFRSSYTPWKTLCYKLKRVRWDVEMLYDAIVCFNGSFEDRFKGMCARNEHICV